MDYIQRANYWGMSYWGGNYWGAIGTRHAEVLRVNLVMNRSVSSVGVMALEVPALQVMNLTVSDRYDELEEL